MRNANNSLIGKSEGKNHFEDLGVYRWIIIILTGTGCDYVDWFHLAREIILRTLRYYATTLKVKGSLPDEFNAFFFNVTNPSICTMALGLTA
jgi:hypothetical protein